MVEGKEKMRYTDTYVEKGAEEKGFRDAERENRDKRAGIRL